MKNDPEDLLRRAAAEIRKLEINGWGNACELGADEIARLKAAGRTRPGMRVFCWKCGRHVRIKRDGALPKHASEPGKTCDASSRVPWKPSIV